MIGLFDVDGTILDSMGIYEDLGRNYLKSRGIDASKDLDNLLYPMSFWQSAAYLKDHYHLDDSMDEISLSIQQSLSDFYKDQVQLKEGIIDVLEDLTGKQYTLYLITSTAKELVEVSFKRLGIKHYFLDIYTCDDFKLPKNQLFYLEVLKRVQVKPEDCLVFEDNADSALAAQQCGMKVIGIQDQYARKDIKDVADRYILKWQDFDVDNILASRF